jgi:hypothetical protein
VLRCTYTSSLVQYVFLAPPILTTSPAYRSVLNFTTTTTVAAAADVTFNVIIKKYVY